LNNTIKQLKLFFIEHKILIQNFSSLSILQIFGMIFPLITYTYLIRILKSDIYGLIVFAQTVVQYFIIFINYGFNISATQSISLNRNNKTKISEIISAVFFIKTMIMLFSFMIMFLLIITIPFFEKESKLFIISMFLCIQEAIFPTWYFLGMEKMKYVTIINVLSRLIFTVLIFILVNKKEDYVLVPILNGIGAIVAGLYSLYIVFRDKEIIFSFLSKNKYYQYFKESTYFFISNVSGMIYSNASKFILGATGHMSEVTFYDIGEKILSLIKNLVSIVEQTIFPRISLTKDIVLFDKIKNYTILVVSIICSIIVVFSKQIITLLAGKSMISANVTFSILILSAIPITLSTFWGHVMLLAWNKKTDFLKLKIISLLSFIFILLITLLFINLSSLILSWIFLINETLIVFYTFYFSKKIIYVNKKNYK